MNRRSFLKGLVGTAAAISLAAIPDDPPPIDYKALRQMAKTQGFGQAYGMGVRGTTLRVKPGEKLAVELDGVAIKPGECVLVTGASDPSQNGIWKVTDARGSTVTLTVGRDGTHMPLKRPEPTALDLHRPTPKYTWPQPRRRRA